MKLAFTTQKSFKDTFKKLFKKYHPDNGETGDKETFIYYRDVYDKVVKNGLLNKLPEDKVEVTLSQAFYGAVIKKFSNTITIKPKSYLPKDSIEFIDKITGERHFCRFTIVSDNEGEEIQYEKGSGNMKVIRHLYVNVFDAIIGGKFALDIFGKKVILTIKSFKLFRKPVYTLCGQGFWKKDNRNERGDYVVHFHIREHNLTESDKQVLEEMRKRYC